MPTNDNTSPTNADLAEMLIDGADSIENVVAHEFEGVIRLATERLRHTDDVTPLLPSLVAELRNLARDSQDSRTSSAIFWLLGREWSL
jgi:hypothetical protein